MNKRKRTMHNHLLPYETIRAATEGDADAVDIVLRHYENYITRLSMRPLFDENGNTYLCVDETMRRRLEIKLIAGILSFRAV